MPSVVPSTFGLTIACLASLVTAQGCGPVKQKVIQIDPTSNLYLDQGFARNNGIFLLTNSLQDVGVFNVSICYGQNLQDVVCANCNESPSYLGLTWNPSSLADQVVAPFLARVPQTQTFQNVSSPLSPDGSYASQSSVWTLDGIGGGDPSWQGIIPYDSRTWPELPFDDFAVVFPENFDSLQGPFVVAGLNTAAQNIGQNAINFAYHLFVQPVPAGIPTVPTNLPSSAPSSIPSSTPSSVPSSVPSSLIGSSSVSSSVSSSAPSPAPSSMPSSAPSSTPSSVPSSVPSSIPSSSSSSVPSSTSSSIIMSAPPSSSLSRDSISSFASTTTPISPPLPSQTLWGQCGGRGWSGPSKCTASLACVALGGDDYSQCLPWDSEGCAATSTRGRSTTQAEYGQCGGTGWAGPRFCGNSLVCIKRDDYYSQCLLEDSRSHICPS